MGSMEMPTMNATLMMATTAVPSVPTLPRTAEAPMATANRTMVGSGGEVAVPPPVMKSCHTRPAGTACVPPSGRCWLSEITAPAQQRTSKPVPSAINVRGGPGTAGGSVLAVGGEVAATCLSLAFGNLWRRYRRHPAGHIRPAAASDPPADGWLRSPATTCGQRDLASGQIPGRLRWGYCVGMLRRGRAAGMMRFTADLAVAAGLFLLGVLEVVFRFRDGGPGEPLSGPLAA